MSDRTKVLTVHKFRRVARAKERRLQAVVDHMNDANDKYRPVLALRHDLPSWAKGVRVEKAGLLQWAVVATEHKGR